ncbi:MAG: transcriptional repressor [Candidatus Latescibacteria bacterium]|nr:transcriptional repressor [Candidatus Latescibacterota bacterium]
MVTLRGRDKEERLRTFERRCKELGLSSTLQRRLILEVVLDLDDHPTADRVCEAVEKRVPGISRTTVYRTLETLVRTGVITKTSHTGKAVRFDTNIQVHHHLVCLRCDEVVDVMDKELDALRVPDTSEYGFHLTDFQVQLRGICRRCRQKEKTG